MHSNEEISLQSAPCLLCKQVPSGTLLRIRVEFRLIGSPVWGSPRGSVLRAIAACPEPLSTFKGSLGRTGHTEPRTTYRYRSDQLSSTPSSKSCSHECRWGGHAELFGADEDTS